MVKPQGEEASTKEKPCILLITLPSTTARAHSSMEFIWDPYNSQESHKNIVIEIYSPLLYRLEG
jgi:hypothetical protein